MKLVLLAGIAVWASGTETALNRKALVMDLEERVKRLEEIVAQQAIGGLGQTVVASKFQLIDDAGKLLAEMKPTSQGVKLTLNDAEKKCQVSLSATNFGPVLRLDRFDSPGAISCWVGEKGEQCLRFHKDQNNSMRLESFGNFRTLMFSDDAGHARLWVQVNENGFPEIGLRDSCEGARAAIRGHDNGTYILSLGDKEGKACVGFQVDAAGNPDLYIRGNQGERKMMVSFDEQKRGMTLYDEHGRPRLIMALDANDQPHVMLANDEGKPRVSVSSDDENSGLRVYDSHEKVRLAVTVNADERPMVAVFDASETIRLRMTLLPDDSSTICLCNDQGRTDILLTIVKGSPQIVVIDQNSRPRAILSMIEGNPTLVFVDENGEPTFKAP